MNKHRNSLKLVLILILFSFFSCEKDENNTNESESIDIQISTNYPVAVYSSLSELESELDSYIEINNSNIPSESILKAYEIDEENNEVKITVSISEEYSQYSDIDLSNNFIIMPLLLESVLITDALELLSQQSTEFGGTYDQKREMEEVLCDNLNTYDFENAETITIPITFYNHISSDLNLQDFQNAISNLNQNYSASKIQFELEQIEPIGTSGLNLDFDNYENYPQNENSINVYVAPFISSNFFEGLLTPGIANFPTTGYAKVFIMSRYMKESIDPQSFTLSHELGHIFSLYHTHENDGYPNNFCGFSGDGINETVAHVDNWTNFDSCTEALGQNEIIMNNFLSYSWAFSRLRDCNRRFLNEQHKRMRFSAEYWYSNLFNDASQLSQSINFYSNVDIIFETDDSLSDIFVTDNGMHVYYIMDEEIYHKELESPFDFSNLETSEKLTGNGSLPSITSFMINPDGTEIIAGFNGNLSVPAKSNRYSLPEPYSLNEYSLNGTTSRVREYLKMTDNQGTFYEYRFNNFSTIVNFAYKTTFTSDNDFSNDDFVTSQTYDVPFSNSVGVAIDFTGNSLLISNPNTSLLQRYEMTVSNDLDTVLNTVESELDFSEHDAFEIDYYNSEEQFFIVKTFNSSESPNRYKFRIYRR